MYVKIRRRPYASIACIQVEHSTSLDAVEEPNYPTTPDVGFCLLATRASIEAGHSLSSVHIAFALITLALVNAAMHLIATDGPTEHADRGVRRDGVTTMADQCVRIREQ